MSKINRVFIKVFGPMDPILVKMMACALVGTLYIVIVDQFFHLDEIIFIFNSMVIVTKTTIGQTKKATSERLVGTGISLGIGLILFGVFRNDSFIVPIDLAITTFLSFFYFDRFIRSFLVSSLMLTLGATGIPPLEYSFLRVINTIIGVAIAIAIGYLYTHPFDKAVLKNEVYEALEYAKGLYKSAINRSERLNCIQIYEFKDRLESIEDKLDNNNGVFTLERKNELIDFLKNISYVLSDIGILFDIIEKNDNSKKNDFTKNYDELIEFQDNKIRDAFKFIDKKFQELTSKEYL